MIYNTLISNHPVLTYISACLGDRLDHPLIVYHTTTNSKKKNSQNLFRKHLQERKIILWRVMLIKYRRKGSCRQRNTKHTPTSHAKDTHTHTITHTASRSTS